MNPYGHTETDNEPPSPFGGAQGAAHRFAQDLEKARYVKGAPEELLGEGGIGRVVVAHETLLRRVVAMKTLRQDRSDAAHEARLIREARITGILEHPSIVPVHDIGENDQGDIFYTMKKVEGMTLREIIEKLGPIEPRMTEVEKSKRGAVRERFGSIPARLGIFQKVCDAVAFAHAHPLRVIHRDLKPENIMVGNFGEVLVMDWGLAKVLGQADDIVELPDEDAPDEQRNVSPLSATGQMGQSVEGFFMGTDMYAPPEQLEGRLSEVDERSDVYALGGILYHLLTLQPPLDRKTIRRAEQSRASPEATSSEKPDIPIEVTETETERVPGTANPYTQIAEFIRAGGAAPLLRGTMPPGVTLPEALRPLLVKALEPDLEKRIKSANQFGKAISQYLSGVANDFEDAGAWKHFTYFVKRHKALSGVSVTAFLIIVFGSALFSWGLLNEKNKVIDERDQKEQQREIAQNASEQKALALADKTAILRSASNADHAEAERLLKVGQPGEALAHFARAIHLDSENVAAVAHGRSAMVYGLPASLAQPVEQIKHVKMLRSSSDGMILYSKRDHGFAALTNDGKSFVLPGKPESISDNGERAALFLDNKRIIAVYDLTAKNPTEIARIVPDPPFEENEDLQIRLSPDGRLLGLRRNLVRSHASVELRSVEGDIPKPLSFSLPSSRSWTYPENLGAWSMRFSQSGRFLLAYSFEELHVADAKTQSSYVLRLPGIEEDNPRHIAVNGVTSTPDERHVVAIYSHAHFSESKLGDYDSSDLAIWDTNDLSSRPKLITSVAGQLVWVETNAQGDQIAAVSVIGSGKDKHAIVWVWTVLREPLRIVPLVVHTENVRVRKVRFSPDGRLLFILSEDGRVSVIDPSNGANLGSIINLPDPILELWSSPSLDTFWVGSGSEECLYSKWRWSGFLSALVEERSTPPDGKMLKSCLPEDQLPAIDHFLDHRNAVHLSLNGAPAGVPVSLNPNFMGHNERYRVYPYALEIFDGRELRRLRVREICGIRHAHLHLLGKWFQAAGGMKFSEQGGLVVSSIEERLRMLSEVEHSLTASSQLDTDFKWWQAPASQRMASPLATWPLVQPSKPLSQK
jgi:serine/threonine protein kinase/WD40 repeat protein